ncbi:E3 ubiquitin-protein ligase ZNRF2-like [Xenia sp. Carnegie-2017]|uniref:E3 ubiquitin-protein ligase ZNRF2-like n=1 Tax=Xenia sp. Carnegie-2017 TaxID=2897299 RepID=UPI001F0426D6|nr:E3 ubiquitin-protein ligase ZNRF2-like [Xenia sp. Carnegie-2017]
MGTKLSSPSHNRRNHPNSVTGNEVQNGGGTNISRRGRTRSMEVGNRAPTSIPIRQMRSLDISDDNETNDSLNTYSMLHTRSLPGQLFGLHGIKCPVCSKFVPSEEVEIHLVMCLTKPQLSYNVDVLTQDSGECVICLEELLTGDKIARLPCLCIYHKSCIDSWFQKNRSCPEHPS